MKPDGTRHTLSDVFHGRTHFDFAGRRWRWAAVSGTVLVICVAGLLFKGLNLGIDFTGGTAIDVQVEGDAPSVGTVRDALRPTGFANAQISIREDRESGQETVHVETEELATGQRGELESVLGEFGEIVGVREVGPSWGRQVSEKAVRALVVFLAVVALYLWIRWEWKMAISALAAVVHDVIITAGVYAITGFEVAPATVVAFLTILGFSLYDTVVVFDKVRENAATLGSVRGDTYTAMVNRSMNQVLMRSLNTSFVALLPVVSLLVVGSGLFGAVALSEFALALFVGLVAGSYSSIFVATPVLAALKEREPRMRALRERSGGSGREVVAVATPASEPIGVLTDDERARQATPAPRPAPAAPGATRPPRPRQQRRRKRR